MRGRFTTQRIYTGPGKIHNGTDDFVCRSCGAYVSTDEALSGIRNRNHCPYCLASRHLDQFAAGDRLSACKGQMQPIGLTLKRLAKKYAENSQGELMLVHQCDDCGKISINRIAADDSDDLILSLLEKSDSLNAKIRDALAQDGVDLLDVSQVDLVRGRLFGVSGITLQER